MNHILKVLKHSKGVYGLSLLVLAISICLSVVPNQTVSAWCDQNAPADDVCLYENFEGLADKRGLTEQQYAELATSCMSGEPGGWDFGSVDQGSCNNAVAICLNQMIDAENCNDKDVLANIAFWCDSSRKCTGQVANVIYDKNNETVTKAREAAEQSALDTCTQNGSAVDKKNQRDQCKKLIAESCTAPNTDTLSSDKKFNEGGYAGYKQCLESALISNAKDPAECKARTGGKGIYMLDETTGPRGENVVRAGCHKQASDLINKEACEAAGRGFEWRQTNKPGEPTAWGCVDPQDPNGDSDEKSDDPDATCLTRLNPQTGKEECINQGFEEVAGECGRARTNIISCDGEGAGALGNVLRIFVIVLSIGIGIGAVGGLAYAAMLYAKAEDNSGNVSTARTLILNIVIGLFLYGFMLAIIQWLVPGGVIG